MSVSLQPVSEIETVKTTVHWQYWER